MTTYSEARTLRRLAREGSRTQGQQIAGFSLLLLVMIVLAGYKWADWAVIDEVTRGEGTVIPSRTDSSDKIPPSRL